MLKVCSYALFNRFYDVIPVILRAHFSVFPSFQFRLHHDSLSATARYWPVLQRLHDSGHINLVHVPGEPMYTRAMLWRMMPMWDTDVDFVFCRDLDALPQPKDRRCVEQFIGSEYSTHGINDNPSHTIPLMGGLCGFHCRSFVSRTGLRCFEDLVFGRHHWSEHGEDQHVLASLWPQLKSGALIHRLRPEDQVYQDCACIIGPVDDQTLTDVHPEVAQCGDRFINHVGAAGCNTPSNEMMAFYDALANDGVKAVIAAEFAEGCPPPGPPMPVMEPINEPLVHG
jgi:hypothetical protein